MNWLLVIAFLFAVGSLMGWVLEFFFRNMISHKGPRGKFFINPGFCKGPYLPIYGIGLTVMFLISYFLTPDRGPVFTVAIVIGIGLCMTLIELTGGFLLLKLMNIRLWDYRKFRGNIGGYVCPVFSLIWTALGALFYVLIFPMTIDWLVWLSQNLAFSFVIGLFFGLFVPDMIAAGREAMIIREFGEDQEVIVRYEELKRLVQERRLANRRKPRFFNQTADVDADLLAVLSEHREATDPRKK